MNYRSHHLKVSLLVVFVLAIATYVKLSSFTSLLQRNDLKLTINTQNDDNDGNTQNDGNNENDEDEQKVVILAGPHKTGSSSLQYNFLRWTTHTPGTLISELNPHDIILKDWVWPLPSFMSEFYSVDDIHNAFYPMMEALRSPKRKTTDREVFEKYSIDEVIDMYHEPMDVYWEKGYNLIFGTEAMDLIVKLEEGAEMIDALQNRILPSSVRDDQITVVIAYRTPKIDHLISQWHQICKPPNQQSFFDFITTTKNKFGPLDALGMVKILLKHTNWNVALMDLEWLKANEWDMSNYIACYYLQAKCNYKKRQIKGLVEGEEPAVKNVRTNQGNLNISNEALDEMNGIIMAYDCNYMDLFEKENERMILLHRLGIDKMIANCQSLRSNSKKSVYPTRLEMKEDLVKVAIKYGAS
jgi:tmRNA-binding protein